jgi:murein DD-endopeptidase MepM/ murein hydrolase activator NlpD
MKKRQKQLLGLLFLAVLLAALLIHQKAISKSEGLEATATTSLEQGQKPLGVSISINPPDIRQGDPAEIMLNGVKNVSEVKSLTYKGKNLGVFMYDNKPTAFVGIDLKEKTGSYPLVLTLKDGSVYKQSIFVGSRAIAEAPLGIPESLGGNTPTGESNLLKSLAADNATLATLTSTQSMLWGGKFIYPVENPIVTDTYGYTRLTGASTISHKGTDFHAPPGTKVYAMNGGVVRFAKMMTSYGNTIVIDHGFGLMTLYMHLSELDVKVGDKITKGELVGLSGQTGYAEGPHLHISVRINGISIDPEKFLKFF